MTVEAMMIEILVDSEAALRERVRDLETDCGVYRLLVVTALDALADLTRKYDRLVAASREHHEAARARREELLLADQDDTP